MVASGVFTTVSLVSYCSAADVLAQLQGYDTSGWGSAEELETAITGLLAQTREAVDGVAGRDFMLHPGETVRLDGSGTRVLLLSPHGLHPVTQIESVVVEGRALEESDWLFYAEEGALVLAASSTFGVRFPEGNQNVEVTLDWGYETPPADVRLAQAKLTAAELLARNSGEQGGVEAVRIGDYSVRYEEGRHGYTIRRLVAEAEELLGRHRRPELCVI